MTSVPLDSIDKLPRFSVVVPTYNRPNAIRACVASLLALDYPPDRYEILVVDDGGSTPAEPAVREATGDDPAVSVRVIRQSNGGPSKARNRGAAEANFEWLALLDDDCAAKANWLRAFAAAAEKHPGALLGGRPVNALTGNPYASASQVLNDFGLAWAGRLGKGTGPRDAWLFPSMNIACPTAVFHAVGGYDESFGSAAGEDYDFCHELQHLGHPAAYVPDAVVRHSHAMGLRGFWRQHYTYGGGLLLFRRRANRRIAADSEKNFGKYQRALVAHTLARVRGPKTAGVSLLVALSQFATITGALAEYHRNRKIPPQHRPLKKPGEAKARAAVG